MPTVKQAPCCARVNARLVMEEANLARLAKKAAARSAKGLSIVLLQERIASAKLSIESVKEAIVDHEASHAGGGF